MKIIAEGAGFFLAKMTADEVAQIEGYRSAYQREQDRAGRVKIGLEIDVTAWREAAEHVSGERERLERLRGELTREVERLDRVLEAVGAPVLES